MAHYAFLDDNNIVTEVIVGIDETELIEGIDPETWYGQFRGQRCVRTSYNHKIRGHYAAIGDRYDDTLNLFIAPQPYPSWLMLPNGYWQAPMPYPTDGRYTWDETNQEWVPVD
jgi:hypothetical protein